MDEIEDIKEIKLEEVEKESNEKKTEIFKMLKNFARTSGEIIFNEAVKTFEKLKDQS